MGLFRTEYDPRKAGDPLRLDRCPDCYYPLTGLPPQGLCPECGAAYDSNLIVLYGPQRKRGDVKAMSRVTLRELVAGLLGLLAILATGALALLTLSWYPAWLQAMPRIILLLLIPLGVSMYWAWRQRRDDLPGPWQLRLCPAGFAERHFTGQAKLHPWTADLEVEVYTQHWPPLDFPWRRWPSEYHWIMIRICKPIGLVGQWALVDFGAGCELQAAQEISRRIRYWCQAAGGVFLEPRG